MALARMIWYYVPEKRIWKLKPQLLAVVFVSLDIVSFLVQGIGGSMAGPGSSASQIQTGLHIYMAGIGIQEFFILCFFALAVKFQLRMQQLEKITSIQGMPQRWRPLLYMLYVSLVLITVRIIFRLVEFSGGVGPNSPILSHESYQYVLDALPMTFAILVWNFVHPGRFLQGPESVMPSGTLRRIFCCCCCRGRKEKNKKQSNETSQDNEIKMESHLPSNMSSNVMLPEYGYGVSRV
jgi:hypothetical protein